MFYTGLLSLSLKLYLRISNVATSHEKFSSKRGEPASNLVFARGIRSRNSYRFPHWFNIFALIMALSKNNKQSIHRPLPSHMILERLLYVHCNGCVAYSKRTSLQNKLCAGLLDVGNILTWACYDAKHVKTALHTKIKNLLPAATLLKHYANLANRNVFVCGRMQDF